MAEPGGEGGGCGGGGFGLGGREREREHVSVAVACVGESEYSCSPIPSTHQTLAAGRRRHPTPPQPRRLAYHSSSAAVPWGRDSSAVPAPSARWRSRPFNAGSPVRLWRGRDGDANGDAQRRRRRGMRLQRRLRADNKRRLARGRGNGGGPAKQRLRVGHEATAAARRGEQATVAA
uniref:Uncharacterized protein n=1 Tax=Oryza glumipatula TaxID=40148 RepID=A0A0E0AYT0_9ORYZ